MPGVCSPVGVGPLVLYFLGVLQKKRGLVTKEGVARTWKGGGETGGTGGNEE